LAIAFVIVHVTNKKLLKQIIVFIDLNKRIKKQKVFDDPKRDPRGRFITNVFYWKHKDEKKPPILSAGDDAAEYFWININNLEQISNQFYALIIKIF